MNRIVALCVSTLLLPATIAFANMPALKEYSPQPEDISPEGFNWTHRDLALIYSGTVYEHDLKGIVRKPELSQRKGQLISYLNTLSDLKKRAFSKWDLKHQKAFVINAHNARELLKEIDSNVAMDAVFTQKEVDRFIKQEPRLLLMMHCSEKHCPEYRNRVINFKNLDVVLEQSAYRFFMDKDKNYYDAKKKIIFLSSHLKKHQSLFSPKFIAHYFKSDPAAQKELAKKRPIIKFLDK